MEEDAVDIVNEEGDAIDLGEESPMPKHTEGGTTLPQPTEVDDQLKKTPLNIKIDEDEEPFQEEEILDSEHIRQIDKGAPVNG
jgi:hypothetical protein